MQEEWPIRGHGGVSCHSVNRRGDTALDPGWCQWVLKKQTRYQ